MRVLLVGDSISLDYGKFLCEFIRKDIQLVGKEGAEEAYQNLDIPIGGNGGDSNRVLRYIQELEKEEKLNFAYFVFNCGLHDIKRNLHREFLQVDAKTYLSNLQQILEIMKKNQTEVIFINTTPADENRYGDIPEFIRYGTDVLKYNALAEELMRRYGVEVIDLFSFTEALEEKGDDLFRDHTHFQPNVIRMQAAYIAGALNKILPSDTN